MELILRVFKAFVRIKVGKLPLLTVIAGIAVMLSLAGGAYALMHDSNSPAPKAPKTAATQEAKQEVKTAVTTTTATTNTPTATPSKNTPKTTGSTSNKKPSPNIGNLALSLNKTSITLHIGGEGEDFTATVVDGSLADITIISPNFGVLSGGPIIHPPQKVSSKNFELTPLPGTQPGTYKVEVKASYSNSQGKFFSGSAFITVIVQPEPTFELNLNDGDWVIDDMGTLSVPFTISRLYGHNFNISTNTNLIGPFTTTISVGHMFIGKGSSGSNTITIGAGTPAGVYSFETCASDEWGLQACVGYDLEVQ